MLRQAYQSSSYRSLAAEDAEQDNGAGRDRWLVSYADFMTLLMAFFVVMYSISQVSEQKYRVLSETFTQAFNPTSKTEVAVQEGDPQLSHTVTPIDMEGHALVDRPGNDANDVPESFVRISEQLEQSFQSLIENELITVTGDERWLQIELQSAILFGSGGASLSDAAAGIIGELTAALAEHKNVIRVEGFTDDIPISTAQFGSNWELSTARATAVVRLMESQGIDSTRMAAVGYGEHQPAESNRSEAGRARNRRIVLMVSTREQLRPNATQVDDLQIGEGGFGSGAGDGLVKGLDVSARAQAEAWFARLNAARAEAEGLPIDAAAAGAEVERVELEGAELERAELENTAAQIDAGLVDTLPLDTESNNAVDDTLEKTNQTVDGVKQVELENGALLFTRDVEPEG